MVARSGRADMELRMRNSSQVRGFSAILDETTTPPLSSTRNP